MSRLHARVLYLLSQAPKDPDHPYWSYRIYGSYEQYRQAVSFRTYACDIDSSDYRERTHLGWVAQICAGALGTAIEGYKTDNIRRVFGEIRDYPRTPNTFNDDITYELAFLDAFRSCGYQVTSKDIALSWAGLVPCGWSAEEIALRNIKSGILPPESGTFHNPFCEWIGAQMKGGICGMVAPGDAYLAAKLAWADAEVAHANNGILG